MEGLALKQKLKTFHWFVLQSYILLWLEEILTIDRFGFIANPSMDAFAVVKENYAFDTNKKKLFISAKVAKALNLRSGSLAQVN